MQDRTTDKDITVMLKELEETTRQIDELRAFMAAKAETLEKFLNVMKNDPEKIIVMDGGFGIPQEEWAVIINGPTHYLSFEQIATKPIHQWLTELANARCKQAHLAGCLRKGGFQTLMERFATESEK